MKKLLISLLTFYRRFRTWQLSLRGKTWDDHHADRIVSGKAWDEFCDALKAAGATLKYAGTPQDPFNQAEGYRYLTRLLRAGLENFIEYADPAFPVLRRMVHETVKMGADNPDNFYQNARISGEYEYRITGKRNTIHYLAFAAQKGGYELGKGLETTGFLEVRDMHLEPDGSFELILSKEPKGKNWLRLESESSLFIVRQTFLDRSTEQLADLHIECIGGPESPSILTPKALDEGLTSSSALVAGASLLFARWARGFQEHTNRLPRFDPAVSNAAGGLAEIAYYHSYWQLGPDEGLLIEVMPPKCDHWNFQLNNHWMESLDYRYHQVHLNKHTAHYEPDGSLRIFVAHTDPGHPNWIRTLGHECGTMCFRWVRGEEEPEPVTKIIELARDLAR
ncbi:MAG: DUF1214 domain-containing protein [Lewinellaceae bacterium]|nr:DUF1214 domain-containing protein [Lewinellaceae bacterium]